MLRLGGARLQHIRGDTVIGERRLGEPQQRPLLLHLQQLFLHSASGAPARHWNGVNAAAQPLGRPPASAPLSVHTQRLG